MNKLLWLFDAPRKRRWRALQQEWERQDEEIAQHWKEQQAFYIKFAEAIERSLRPHCNAYHFRVGKNYKHMGMFRGTFFMYYDATLADDEVVFVLGKYHG